MTIAKEPPALAESLWTATAGPAPDCPTLQGEAQAEVAVVGGGFTGLSAALHLAEKGVSVALLEAETPGWGASGRNGGQVNPGLKYDPDELERVLGPEMGARAARFSGAAADLVFGLIEKHAIACDPLRSGWIQPAHDAAGLATLRSRVEQWQRRGAPLELLSKAETARLVGSDAYVGGAIDRRGGNLHPLNYALGLARAAQGAGARLHGHSRVTRLERRSEGFRLHTAQGVLSAGQVLLCTNGYTDGLVEALRRSVIPVCSVQVATRPLSENLRRSILPEGQAASDTRRLLLYFRKDAEGRLIMGGRGAYGQAGIAAQQESLRRVTREVFPQLGEIDWSYRWGGYVCMTADHLPHLQQIEPGITAALGYNGRGVALATAMGRLLAERAAGAEDRDLDFPVTGVTPIPFHGLRRPAVSLLVAWYRLRDRLGY